MEKWRKNLAATLDTGQILIIDRAPEIEEKIEGYLVGMSEFFVLLHIVNLESINLNGYVVLRIQDIRRYRVTTDYESFLNRAFQLKGIHPLTQPQVDLSSFSALFSSTNAHFPLLTLHREIMDSEICFIGKVQKLTEKTMTLAEISPAAKWERVRRYNFRDITRVDFGGAYEEALALVAVNKPQI